MATADAKTQIIDHLNGTYARLNNLIQRSRATTPDERSALSALVRARDEVRDLTRRLLDDGFQAAGADLERAGAKLAAITDKLERTKSRLDSVKAVLDLAAQVVKIASQVAMAV